MSFRRRKMSRRQNRRNFRRGNRVNKRNNIPVTVRGGYRM